MHTPRTAAAAAAGGVGGGVGEGTLWQVGGNLVLC